MSSTTTRALLSGTVGGTILVLALPLAAPAHAAPPPESGAIYATPANIEFQYINLEETYVSDAAGQYTSDAWDDTGVITLYPQDPATNTSGSVGLDFSPGDCTVTGTWDGDQAEYVGATTATCAKGVSVGGSDFDVTLTRSFVGSWARWQLVAERDFGAGELFGRFDADLGSDSLTCYYAEDDDRDNLVSAEAVAGIADGVCPSVTPVSDPSRPVLYTNVDKPVSSRTGLSNGTESQFYEFPLLADGGTGSFTYSTAVIDYVTGSPSSFLCALDTALDLSGGDFGSVLTGCTPRPAADPSKLPPSWYQAYARGVDEACETGWRPSWAQWPNDGAGGFVCDREEYWNVSTNAWAFRALGTGRGKQ